MNAEDGAVPIAFCITGLEPGGAERALVRLVTQLDRSDWDPAVYCLGPKGRLADDLETAKIPVTCFEAVGIFQLPLIVWRLTRALRRQRPKILQTFLFHANIAGRIAAKCASVPVVVSGIRVAEKRYRSYLWADRLTAGMVDRHVCVSEGVARFSHEVGRLPLKRLTVISNGVEFAKFAEAEPAVLRSFGIGDEATVVLTVGRLDPQKGTDRLVPCARDWLERRADAHWLFVGEGPLRAEMTQLAKSSSVADRMHFPGQREDVPALLKRADLFVLASRWEGQANVLLEAMASGTPVISTPVEGTEELIDDRRRGWLTPDVDAPSFPEGLHAALTTLADAAEMRQEISTNAQLFTKIGFASECATSKYAALYAELLRSRSE